MCHERSEMKNLTVSPVKRQAAKLLDNRPRVARLVAQAARKAEQNKVAVLRVWDDLLTLIRLVRAWTRRQYTVVPWQTLVAAIAALIYFVNPFDLIPDFLHGIGFVDDATFVALVVSAIRDDLERFRQWEQAAASSTQSL